MPTRTVVVLCLLLMSGPAWAGGPESFDPDAPFKQALSMNLLRSFLNEAMDRLEDHVDMSGTLIPDERTSDRHGRMQFKFYPEGKSRSGQHLTAEGFFRLAPDDTVRDFSFRFKNPETSSRRSAPPSGDIL
jgi:hypothetical protein